MAPGADHVVDPVCHTNTVEYVGNIANCQGIRPTRSRCERFILHRYKRSQRGKAIRELNDLDLQYQKAYVTECINQIQVPSDAKKTREAYKIINQITAGNSGRKASKRVYTCRQSRRALRWLDRIL